MHKFAALLLLSSTLPAADWLTFAHDPQRTGWAAEERTITPAVMGDFELKWKSKMKSENYSLSALTAPVVAGGVSTAHGIKNVVYVAGIDGNVFGIETDTGELAWTRNLPTHTTAKKYG